MKGGRSLGTLGSGLFWAMFRNERAASREFEELRDDERLATYKQDVLAGATGGETRRTKVRKGSTAVARGSYHATAASSPTPFLDLVAIAAHLHEDDAQLFGFGDQALQELCPASGIAAHG